MYPIGKKLKKIPKMTNKEITLSKEQVKYIKENYKVMPNIEICKNLGITKSVFYKNVSLICPVKYEDVYFKHEKLVTI